MTNAKANIYFLLTVKQVTAANYTFTATINIVS